MPKSICLSLRPQAKPQRGPDDKSPTKMLANGQALPILLNKGIAMPIEIKLVVDDVVNSYINFLIALGTIGAVITSLYLAKRGDRIRLSVYASIYMVGSLHQFSTSKPFVIVTATNVSRRTATITGVTYRMNFFKKKYFSQMLDLSVAHSLPFCLKDGEEYSIRMPLNDFTENLADAIYNECEFSPAIAACSLRIKFHTSAAGSFSCGFGKNIRDELVKAILKRRGEESPTPSDES